MMSSDMNTRYEKERRIQQLETEIHDIMSTRKALDPEYQRRYRMYKRELISLREEVEGDKQKIRE